MLSFTVLNKSKHLFEPCHFSQQKNLELRKVVASTIESIQNHEVTDKELIQTILNDGLNVAIMIRDAKLIEITLKLGADQNAHHYRAIYQAIRHKDKLFFLKCLSLLAEYSRFEMIGWVDDFCHQLETVIRNSDHHAHVGPVASSYIKILEEYIQVIFWLTDGYGQYFIPSSMNSLSEKMITFCISSFYRCRVEPTGLINRLYEKVKAANFFRSPSFLFFKGIVLSQNQDALHIYLKKNQSMIYHSLGDVIDILNVALNINQLRILRDLIEFFEKVVNPQDLRRQMIRSHSFLLYQDYVNFSAAAHSGIDDLRVDQSHLDDDLLYAIRFGKHQMIDFLLQINSHKSGVVAHKIILQALGFKNSQSILDLLWQYHFDFNSTNTKGATVLQAILFESFSEAYKCKLRDLLDFKLRNPDCEIRVDDGVSLVQLADEDKILPYLPKLLVEKNSLKSVFEILYTFFLKLENQQPKLKI